MKSMRFLLPVFIFFIGFTAFRAPPAADAIVGTWLNGTKLGHIQVYKEGGTYFGKLVWISQTINPATGKPRTDEKNANPDRRTRPLLGIPIMYNFKYDGDNIWGDGKIYNPEDGKEYNCKLTLQDPNTLLVRGYVGIPLFGKTQTWTRVK